MKQLILSQGDAALLLPLPHLFIFVLFCFCFIIVLCSLGAALHQRVFLPPRLRFLLCLLFAHLQPSASYDTKDHRLNLLQTIWLLELIHSIRKGDFDHFVPKRP